MGCANDIVRVRRGSEKSPRIRPWLGRIVQILEDENGDKVFDIRWFDFWNQCLDELKSKSARGSLKGQARSFGLFQVFAGDVLESVEGVSCTRQPIGIIKEKVFVVDANGRDDRID